MGFFEDVKQSVRLSDVVGRFTKLSGARGSTMRGCCPIHGGDNPGGFSVNDDTGYWHCWSGECGGGSVIDFAVKMRMAPTPFDAAVLLGREVGVSPPEDSGGVSEATRRAAVDVVCRAAAEQLHSPRCPQTVTSYCADRGISPTVASAWSLGFIHDPDAVLGALRREGLTAAAEDVGIVGRAFGSPTVRPAGRLLMPVCDPSGPVGWSARLIDGVRPGFAPKAKYVNSPESALFRKRETVFGGQFPGQGTRTVVIVEGNVDAIMVTEALRLAGQDSWASVAVCGSALTPGQVEALQRGCPSLEQLVLLFDADDGGLGAYRKCAWLAADPRGLEVVVPASELTRGGGDPADALSPVVAASDTEAARRWMRGVSDTVPLAVFPAAAEPVVDRVAEWVRRVWESSGRDQRPRVLEDAAAAAGLDAAVVAEAVGDFVPQPVLARRGSVRGFAVAVVRELVALDPAVRAVALRRVVAHPMFAEALSLSREDVELVSSLQGVRVSSSGTSDEQVAEFLRDFSRADQPWTVVPAVARHLVASSPRPSRADRLVANAPGCPDGAAAWLWLAGRLAAV